MILAHESLLHEPPTCGAGVPSGEIGTILACHFPLRACECVGNDIVIIRMDAHIQIFNIVSVCTYLFPSRPHAGIASPKFKNNTISFFYSFGKTLDARQRPCSAFHPLMSRTCLPSVFGGHKLKQRHVF